ncbi:FMN-binding protein [Microbacterium azadirachtae]|uniref:FMN-binding domain protein n=1 Tax=Microbacterium azadirachtae TaxID=582680 RepID=A0A0F0LR30_9MICO|nr:FMN-binding protein [Microbacterium azadirachtae]KJL34695.1 FMN-binding domain protein [Microbacterium azadirachtae]
MKKIVYAVLATVTGLVLLFSYRTSLEVVTPAASGAAGTAGATGTAGTTKSATGSSTGTSTSGTSSGTSAGSSSSGSTSSTGSTGSTTSSSGLKDGSFTGQAVDTRYGAVQVAITVSGGQITDVSVPQYPNTERRDEQINAQAIPILVSETKSAQSAQIDMVSGATFTSDGYTQSLQSAIDQAKA